MQKGKIAIIGPGVVGTALARLLHQLGYSIAGIAGSSPGSGEELARQVGSKATIRPEEITREADWVFLTTPDGAIAEVCRVISRQEGFRPGQVVAHMSGALPAAVMEEARQWGANLVSVHPLQSFASPEVAMETLTGSFFALEGDEEAVAAAEKIVLELGGIPFKLAPGTKPLYHAGACIASNYLVSLTHLALTIWAKAGIGPGQGLAALVPLLEGTLANIRKLGPVKALTGPIARGDGATIAGHLEAMKEEQQLSHIYRVLGLYTLKVAREKGSLSPEQALVLQETLLEGGKFHEQK